MTRIQVIHALWPHFIFIREMAHLLLQILKWCGTFDINCRIIYCKSWISACGAALASSYGSVQCGWHWPRSTQGLTVVRLLWAAEDKHSHLCRNETITVGRGLEIVNSAFISWTCEIFLNLHKMNAFRCAPSELCAGIGPFTSPLTTITKNVTIRRSSSIIFRLLPPRLETLKVLAQSFDHRNALISRQTSTTLTQDKRWYVHQWGHKDPTFSSLHCIDDCWRRHELGRGL